MSTDGNKFETDGAGDLNQPITRFHFNALRDTLRREFRERNESLEGRQDRIDASLQQLRDTMNQLVQNLNPTIGEQHQVHGDASVHSGEVDGPNEGVAVPNAQRHHYHVGVNRNNGVAGRGNNGRGRGRGRRKGNRDYVDDEFDDYDGEMFGNDGYHGAKKYSNLNYFWKL